MATLSKQARETIKWWYFGDQQIEVTIAGYIRRHFGDRAWGGDSCGCVDDRCIGFHHAGDEACHCLEAWLDQWVAEQLAALEAAPIWTAYRAAVEAHGGRGDQVAYESAWAAAETWVRRYQGAGVVSFSLDALVDGRAGISVRTRFNDRDHLVWAAPAAVPA